MIPVRVYGPMGEDDVGALGQQNATELLIMLRIDHSAAIVLGRKCRPRFKDAARILSFRGTDPGAAIEGSSPAIALTTIQIQQGYLVSQFGESGDSPSAAAFRVARMAARDDDLGGLLERSGRERKGGDRSQEISTGDGHEGIVLRSTLASLRTYRAGRLALDGTVISKTLERQRMAAAIWKAAASPIAFFSAPASAATMPPTRQPAKLKMP